MKNTLIVASTLLMTACGTDDGPTAAAGDVALTTAGYTCDNIPRPQNAVLPLSDASDDWFQVRESAEGVYSIVEPFHIQETISHLVVGEERALLIDTGIGLLPMRPVVERITELPVTVINTHTHYDHIGGNWEFDSVLAVDSPYTRLNMEGVDHDTVAIDFLPEAFCKGIPENVDVNAYFVKPWHATGGVSDGELIDLGGRSIEVLFTPGHTPDALTLVDRENRLMFTGDTWYDASLWLFVQETNLDHYEASLDRLVEVEIGTEYLFGAHNSARFPAGILPIVRRVVAEIRAGDHDGKSDELGRLAFEVDGVRILTSQQAIDGQFRDPAEGGSGLDLWEN